MTKRYFFICSLAFILIIGSLPVWAASLRGEVKGDLVSDWDWGNKSVEVSAFPTELRLTAEDSIFGGKARLSVRGLWDWVDKDGELSVDELWFSGYTRTIDYTLGRQAISWGTADGFNPTNYFAEMGSGALISGELGTSPKWAAQVGYYALDWSATGVFIPFFAPQKIDSFMRKMMNKNDPAFIGIIEGVAPPKGIGTGSEFGLRFESSLGGWDLQASLFSGFEPLPGLMARTVINPLTMQPTSTTLEGEYRRQNFVGLATAGTIGDAGVWAELAYGGPVPFPKPSKAFIIHTPLAVNKKYFHGVVGADYTLNLGNGLLMQGQYIYRGQGSLLSPYAKTIKAHHYLFSHLSYNFNMDSSLGLVVIHGLEDHSGLLMPVFTYRFPNSIAAELGMLAVYGGKSKEFGVLPSQIRLGVSYKF